MFPEVTMKITILTIAIFFSLPALTGDEVYTLPPTVYQQFKSGKHLDKIWMSPDYDKDKGFGVTKIECKAVCSRPIVIEELLKALTPFEKSNSKVTLHVNITEDTCKLFGPYIIVEGEIIGANGNLIAAFRTKQKGIFISVPHSIWKDNPDWKATCQALAATIVKDIL